MIFNWIYLRMYMIICTSEEANKYKFKTKHKICIKAPIANEEKWIFYLVLENSL